MAIAGIAAFALQQVSLSERVPRDLGRHGLDGEPDRLGADRNAASTSASSRPAWHIVVASSGSVSPCSERRSSPSPVRVAGEPRSRSSRSRYPPSPSQGHDLVDEVEALRAVVIRTISTSRRRPRARRGRVLRPSPGRGPSARRDQDRRVREECTGECDALPLADRQLHALLAHEGVRPVRQRGDPVGETAEPAASVVDLDVRRLGRPSRTFSRMLVEKRYESRPATARARRTSSCRYSRRS